MRQPNHGEAELKSRQQVRPDRHRIGASGSCTPPGHPLIPVIFALLLAAILWPAATAHAQWGGRTRWAPPRLPGDEAQRGEFTFCRLRYTPVRREWLGTGWDTDYPDGDRNLPLRLSQLTRADIARDERGDPFHAVVSPTEDSLYACPFLFASDVGTVRFSEIEAVRLRDYLLKGGFLWADDFWGDFALQNWAIEMGRILPQYKIVEVPPDHVLYHTLYSVAGLPQVPSIQFWRRSGRTGTSERGSESARPALHGIADESGRLMVIMTHNTDIADGWEREGEDDEFFYKFSPDAYAVGINVILYMLTH